jgi:hypothetical protein
MDELACGLWRWTAPHPEWVAGAEPDSPDDWGQMVGCLLYQGPDTCVFIDPLLPPDPEAFWRWADQQVGGRTVSVLTTLAPHRRDRERVAARYGARTPTHRGQVPPGVEPIVLQGARETMFWLPGPAALVPGDRILGAPDGRLRLCPESWLYWTPVDREGLRRLLLPVLDLPVELVVVSHGEPVCRDARAALRRCLEPEPGLGSG